MRHAAGFTLLEVLVAMSLLGVLTSLVYTGMHTGLRAWSAVEERSASAVAERTTRNWLRRQIAALVPIQWQAQNRTRVAFAGDADGFRFFGAWSHATRGAGLYQIELRSERQDDRGYSLVLSYQVRDTERPKELRGVGDVVERRLGDDLEDLRFDYFGAPGGEQVQRWRSNWPAQASRYPQLIRISAEGRGERPWPQLVVALRSTPAEGLL
ncbi:MAG: prepilin-type N-terminal cleavage/methylation domain-containing protein [Gammaproteobacteria bacterium]|nr:prepilin-type N-terminal cleavage/methylation domain-containing protein [Gammaproteobacteria bacterium]